VAIERFHLVFLRYFASVVRLGAPFLAALSPFTP